MKRLFAAALVAWGMLAASVSTAGAATYSLAELGTLGGTSSVAYAINDNGKVVGGSNVTSDTAQHATFWDTNISTTKPTDLGTLGGPDSVGFDVNNAGQIAGQSKNAINRPEAVYWNSTSNSPSSLLANGSAFGVNNLGQFVGGTQVVSNNDTQTMPTFWQIDGTTVTKTLLSTLGGASGNASDINDDGLAIGHSYLAGNGSFHATSWDTTTAAPTAKDLGTLGGTASLARAVNEQRQIVGHSQIIGDSEWHATLWDGQSIVDLGTLGGTDSSAFDINDAGIIVGGSSLAGDVERRATIWINNSIVDLNTLVDLSGVGWLLIDARGINNLGQIVGLAINPDGEERAYLLTPNPIPIPAALPLLMSALGFFGFIGWRKKQVAA